VAKVLGTRARSLKINSLDPACRPGMQRLTRSSQRPQGRPGSQLVFTTARGREAVFWQSPRTRKQARPNVATPTARAAGIAELEILVDTREQYAYRFTTQQVVTVIANTTSCRTGPPYNR
jgi:hypothetical protein